MLAGLPSTAAGLDDYEVYFFGIKLQSFQGCNWTAVAAGAAASLLVHELGHMLYLESQNIAWEHKISFPDGISITFSDALAGRQYRNFGRSGFVLQTSIGALLAAMPVTRHTDFTRGWLLLSSAQLLSYGARSHDYGNDFVMIEKGGGNGLLDQGLFSLISACSLLQTE